jgi:integrase
MGIWTAAGKGIRYREHPIRKHGKKLDRYWCLQYKLQGKTINEAVGWWSAGASQGQCEELLTALRVNQKSGQGPQTLNEMREFNQSKRAAETSAKEAALSQERTLGGFWELEYLPRARLNLTARTLLSHSSVVRRWVTPLAAKSLNSLKPADLENLLIRPMRESGKNPAYIEKALRVFSVIWVQAKALGLAGGDNPVSKIKIIKSDNKRERFLSKAEAVALLAALKEKFSDVHDTAIVSLFSGLRIGECLALTWADVDLAEGSIFVKDTKTKLNRHAFMTAEIRGMLERRQSEQAKSAYVFPSIRGGNGYTDLWLKFSKIVKELGLNQGITDRRQKVVIHTLRHTFASWLVQMGTPLYTVSKLMGHSDIKMTMRYAHLAPDTQRAAAMALEGALAD